MSGLRHIHNVTGMVLHLDCLNLTRGRHTEGNSICNFVPVRGRDFLQHISVSHIQLGDLVGLSIGNPSIDQFAIGIVQFQGSASQLVARGGVGFDDGDPGIFVYNLSQVDLLGIYCDLDGSIVQNITSLVTSSTISQSPAGTL